MIEFFKKINESCVDHCGVRVKPPPGIRMDLTLWAQNKAPAGYTSGPHIVDLE